MTGCVFNVELSSSAGPSAISFHKSCFSTSEASATTSRAAFDSANDCIIPTDCEPCPGKTNANFTASPFNHHRAPRESPAHAFQQHVLAGTDAPVARRFVERKRDRGRRGVGVTVNRQHHLLHAHADLLCGGL